MNQEAHMRTNIHLILCETIINTKANRFRPASQNNSTTKPTKLKSLQ